MRTETMYRINYLLVPTLEAARRERLNMYLAGGYWETIFKMEVDYVGEQEVGIREQELE